VQTKWTNRGVKIGKHSMLRCAYISYLIGISGIVPSSATIVIYSYDKHKILLASIDVVYKLRNGKLIDRYYKRKRPSHATE
jgi:hypothetical protein